MANTTNNRWQLLQQKPLRRMLLANLIAVSGGGMCYIALTWYVLQLNNQLSSVILVSISFWLPSIILGPFAGYIVDKFPRKNILAYGNMLRAISILIIVIVLNYSHINTSVKLDLCFLLNFLSGIIFTLIGPASIALTRELVNDHDLLNATSLADISFELGNIAGIGFTSLLLVSIGAKNCLFITAALVLLSSLLALTIEVKKPQHGQTVETALKEIAYGFKFLINNRYVLFLSLVTATLMIQFMIMPILLAPFVKDVLHETGREFSLIETTLSIGFLVGSIAIPIIANKICWRKSGLVIIILLGICYYLFGETRSMHMALIIYALLGMFLPIWSVIASKAQAATPKHMQGRVLASVNMLSAGCILAIYIVLNLFGNTSNLVQFFDWCACLSAVGFVLLLLAIQHYSAPDRIKNHNMPD